VRKVIFHLVFFMALLMPFISHGADEGGTTNILEELEQLRTRTDALEKKLSETSLAAPAATTVRAGSAYMNISFDALIDAGGSTASHPAQELELGTTIRSSADSRCGTLRLP